MLFMTNLSEMRINLEEEFPHLPNAPIVEAVIEIRTKARNEWKEDNIVKEIKQKLPDYPVRESGRKYQHEVLLETGSKEPAKQAIKDLGWRGLKLTSENKLHIVQLNKDGFIFSWLKPYNEWKKFTPEAFRLWDIYKKIAAPDAIQRIGVRFINRIGIPHKTFQLEDYLSVSPSAPKGLDLPFESFLHRDTLALPDYGYAINITRTIQPAQSNQSNETGIILDIDVFAMPNSELKDDTIKTKLDEMHWLKNKAFFGSITKEALELFK